MRCKTCQKDYAQGVKTAYRLGLKEGENRLKRTINKVLENNNNLLHTNRYLAQELLDLNQLCPLKDTKVITIPLKKALSILGILPKKHSLYKYLQKVIGVQMSSSCTLAKGQTSKRRDLIS